jgi:type III secretion protein J
MIVRHAKQGVRTAVLVGLVLALTACKEDLYTALPERDANEMVAVLAAQGISSSRSRDKDGAYALQVESADVPAAITILRDQGFPREPFQTLGDVFSADGAFSTPFEQHSRYLHAMNQELSATISAIDGVRSARVLVTAPQRERFDQEEPRATAAVAIHYEAGQDIQSKLPSIKTLVAHALPNLNYDDVAVALFEAGGPVVDTSPSAGAGAGTAAMSVLPGSGGIVVTLLKDRLFMLVAAVAAAFAAFLYVQRRSGGS